MSAAAWPRCTASRKAAAAAAAARCTCSTAATQFLRRQRHRRRRTAARGRSRARRPDARRRQRHGLLLRRRRGRRRRVPREPESGRAVGAAGAVRVREQSLRHGNGAGALRIGDRHPAQGGELPDARPRRSTAWTWSRSRPPPGGRSHAVRESGKPYFLECRTYRFRAHSMFDAQLYRDKAEVEAWRHKEPIVRFQGWLEANRMIHPDDLAAHRSRGRRRDRRRRSPSPRPEHGSRSRI